MTRKSGRQRKAVHSDLNNPAYRRDLLILVGSVVVGMPLGILLEAAIRQGDPGPTIPALIFWVGQVVLVRRYWQRDPRPPLFQTRDLVEFRANLIYGLAHVTVVVLPLVFALVVLSSRTTGG